MINWDVSNEDFRLIHQIAERVERDLHPPNPDPFREILMDLMACHANGCPLRLAEFLAADMQDFSHDYYGIRNHLNRGTGKLEDCFTPRFVAVPGDFNGSSV